MNELKLQKLKQLLEIANQDTVTNSDFVNAFKKVMDVFVAMKNANEQQQSEMLKLVKSSILDMQKSVESEMSSAKKDTMQSCMDMMDKMMTEHDKKMQVIDDKLNSVHDGKDADEEKIVNEVLSKIPEDPEETPEELRNKLESLKNENRLDKSAIKGIENIEEDIKNIK